MAMRKYIPTDRDREIVLRLAAIPGITREAIAFAITNERTGRPISRKVLERAFAKELELAMTVMQQITMESFVSQIKAGNWGALRTALSNYCRIKDNGELVVQATQNNIKWNIVGAPSPYVDEPVPEPADIDLEPNPPPHLQLPKRDALPLPEPEPVASQEQPYRTELDIPAATTMPSVHRWLEVGIRKESKIRW